MAQFPDKCNVVVIGLGGIVGSSVMHHLVERGWDDIVGIDKTSVPTDIGSTSHASDFCYATDHSKFVCYTTAYSINFFDQMGHYSRVGGLEVARVGDDDRMMELKRKVASGKAFGTNVKMISAAEAKEKFPLLEEDMIQGAMWDPDAGLVKPRSQTVAGILVDNAVKTGKAQSFANTTATGLDIKDGRIVGVETSRGYIAADHVIVCTGLWGRTIAEMAGEDLPVMPVDHPLTFFGPYTEFEGTGKDIGYPLMRDQGTPPICAIPAIRKHPKAARSNGVITRKRNPAYCIHVIFRKKVIPTGRHRSAISNSSKSWSPWNAPWN